jgi:hypothetical protein
MGPIGSGFVCACNRADEEVTFLIAFVVPVEGRDVDLTLCSQISIQ